MYELLILDEVGNLQSQKWLGLRRFDYTFASMAVTEDDHILLAASKSADTCAMTSCLILIKMTADGDFISSTEFPAEPAINLNIFPNPTDGIFKIEWDLGLINPKSYELYTVAGQTVQNGILNFAGQHEFDISDQSAGVYFLRLTLEDGRAITKRIVKNR